MIRVKRGCAGALTAVSLVLSAACAAPAPGTAAGATPPPVASSASAAAKPAATNPQTGIDTGQGDTLDALIQGARSEGSLNLSWSEDTAGGSRGAQLWVDGFNKLYGLNVTLQFTPGPSMPDLGLKIAQEYQAHQPASSDVMIGSEVHIFDLMRADALIPEDWATWAPNVKDGRLLAPRGVAAEIATRDSGIEYNSDILKGDAIPHTLQDLLKPEFKGKIASTPYAATFDRIASPDVWGEERTLDYVGKLSGQINGLLRCGDVTRLISGEFEALALDCGGYDALNWQRKGAPIAHVIPTDAPVLLYWYMGIPRNSAHPNVAKLFINYILSREGQDVLWEDDAADHHLIPGSHSAAIFDQVEKTSGTKFTSIDVQFVQRGDEEKATQVRLQLQKLLQRNGA